VELGVSDLVPVLNATAVPHQLQQCFWGSSKAGEKKIDMRIWDCPEKPDQIETGAADKILRIKSM